MKTRTEIENYVIEIVKSLRIKQNMSQSELAFNLGVSTGFIGKIESHNSSSKYNLNHINKLAGIFNISPKEFLPKNSL